MHPGLEELVFPLDAIYLDPLSAGNDDTYAGIPVDPSILRRHARTPAMYDGQTYTTTLDALLEAALTKDSMRDLLKEYVNRFFNSPFPLETQFATLSGLTCLVHRKRTESTGAYRSTMGY